MSYRMPEPERKHIEALADEVEDVCGDPAPYGPGHCTEPKGHGGTRHWHDLLNWPAA